MTTKPLERVCYVEDDEDIQRIVRMSLERVGKMKVEIVGDPMVAIDAIVGFKPDLVLLDWMMPGMDGRETARALRANPETKDIPILAATALFRDSDLKSCLEAGCNGYIVKPFTFQELQAKLREFIPQSNGSLPS